MQVTTIYYYNPLVNNFGICDCENPCNGKGKDNTCKKITIAVFKSGKIIITGGRTKHNIQTAYKFINEFIEENSSGILIKERHVSTEEIWQGPQL